MLDAQFWKDIAFGFWETTYMVFLSTLFAYILGMPLGVLLVVTDEKGLKPIPWLNKTIGFIVNILRSVPFVILLIMIIPFTPFSRRYSVRLVPDDCATYSCGFPVYRATCRRFS